MIRASLPTMRTQRGGHIINISSGISGFSAAPGLGAYAATKPAVEALTEALAGAGRTARHPRDGDRAGHVPDRVGRSIDGARRDADRCVCADRRCPGAHGRADERPPARYPARAARVIHQVAHDPSPPRRLALGSDAVASMEARSRSILEGLDQYRDVSRSTDFE